jgi:hypothetical protein
MRLDLGQIASLILALVAVGGAFTSWRLGKRGQVAAEREQAANTRVEDRLQAFDELESINDRLNKDVERLTKENDRLRGLADEADHAGNARLARQAHRCREQLEQLIATVSLLQGVVVQEMARSQAGDAIEAAVRHVARDHPDEEPPPVAKASKL